jgi:hypothetical protein
MIDLKLVSSASVGIMHEVEPIRARSSETKDRVSTCILKDKVRILVPATVQKGILRLSLVFGKHEEALLATHTELVFVELCWIRCWVDFAALYLRSLHPECCVSANLVHMGDPSRIKSVIDQVKEVFVLGHKLSVWALREEEQKSLDEASQIVYFNVHLCLDGAWLLLKGRKLRLEGTKQLYGLEIDILTAGVTSADIAVTRRLNLCIHLCVVVQYWILFLFAECEASSLRKARQIGNKVVYDVWAVEVIYVEQALVYARESGASEQSLHQIKAG